MAKAVVDRAPSRFRTRISRLLGSRRMPRQVLLALPFFPRVLQLAVIMPWQFATSLTRSARDLLKRDVHGVRR